ncbi:hypothetical protein [Granulicella sibirica]|uniref:hypothetical protein n=1 Tax=Granulicella sibirica TaxID=2479048 RepID=UPI001008AD8B|nr:hypothetical protein [Granulicella sibirica]
MKSIEDSGFILELLAKRLPIDRSDSLVRHYRGLMSDLQNSQWEATIVKAGKFAEAVLKCLWAHIGQTVQDGKDFKADLIIRGLEQTPATVAEDFIRLTVPRACRFVYDVASNRGARHDSVNINPNVMDANGVSSACSWVLAELIRYSQAGETSPSAAVEIVARLTEKKYPLFEEIEGRLYFADASVGARKLALLLLAFRYPARISRDELIAAIMRHGQSKSSAQTGVARISSLVDDDGMRCLRLRSVGLKEAEGLLSVWQGGVRKASRRQRAS